MSGCSLAYRVDIDNVEANGYFSKEFWYNVLLFRSLIIISVILISILRSVYISGLTILGFTIILYTPCIVIPIISIIRGIKAFKDYKTTLYNK